MNRQSARREHITDACQHALRILDVLHHVGGEHELKGPTRQAAGDVERIQLEVLDRALESFVERRGRLGRRPVVSARQPLGVARENGGLKAVAGTELQRASECLGRDSAEYSFELAGPKIVKVCEPVDDINQNTASMLHGSRRTDKRPPLALEESRGARQGDGGCPSPHITRSVLRAARSPTARRDVWTGGLR